MNICQIFRVFFLVFWNEGASLLHLAAWSGLISRDDLGVEHRRIESLQSGGIQDGLKDTGVPSFKNLGG